MAPPNQNVIICRGVCMVIFTILYIVAFALPTWIDTDPVSWGLWKYCYSNRTEANVTEDDPCQAIVAGDSPSYFEAVRALACFVLISCVIQFGTLKEGAALNQNKRPVMLSSLSIMLITVMFAMLLSQFKDDERWSGEEKVQLGASFYMTCVVLILNISLSIVHCAYDEARRNQSADKKSKVSPKDGPTPASSVHQHPPVSPKAVPAAVSSTRPHPPVSPTAVPASDSLIHHHPPVRISTSDQPPPRKHSSPGKARKKRVKTGVECRIAGETLYTDNLQTVRAGHSDHSAHPSHNAEFPLLERVPTYTLPPVRGSQVPATAPPSYESAMSREYAPLPPPPGVAVPRNPFTESPMY